MLVTPASAASSHDNGSGVTIRGKSLCVSPSDFVEIEVINAYASPSLSTITIPFSFSDLAPCGGDLLPYYCQKMLGMAEDARG